MRTRRISLVWTLTLLATASWAGARAPLTSRQYASALAQAEGCFAPWAQHRERKLLVRRTDPQPLEASLARFGEPAHRQRYRQRGRWIEGVFGWLKGPFGYGRWWLRGEARVRAEGTLLGLAYQLRTVHKRWAPQHA